MSDFVPEVGDETIIIYESEKIHFSWDKTKDNYLLAIGYEPEIGGRVWIFLKKEEVKGIMQALKTLETGVTQKK